MATDAITQEQAEQNFQEAEDRALMAGADVEDISNIRTRAGKEPAQEVPVIEGEVSFEGFTERAPLAQGFAEKPVGFAPSPKKEEIAPSYQWKSAAAWEHVQKLQTATGITDEEVNEIYNDLVIQGYSTKASGLWAALSTAEKQAAIEGVASVVKDIGADTAAERVQQILTTDNPNVVDDAAIAAVVAQSKDPETMMERWEKEIGIREQFKREYAKALKYVPLGKTPMLEMVESVLPFVHQSDAAQLGKMLQEKFNAPIKGQPNAFFLEGNYLADIRDWITQLPPEEQLNVFRSVLDASDETSGLFTDNDFMKKDMLRQLFAGATGEYVEGNLDVDKYINNAVSLLDLTLIGTLAKGAVSRIAGSSKTSSIETLKRVDPEQGEKVTAAAIADETGSTAASVGTTKEDVVVDAMLTKWKGYAEDPLVSEKFIQRQVELLNSIKNQTVDIGVHLKDVEKQAQRDQLLESLEKAAPLRAELNSSTSSMTEAGIEIEAVYTYNNFDAAKNAIERLHPEAQVIRENENTMRVRIQDNYRAANNVVFDIEDIHGRGNKAKYLGDISANLAKNLSDSFYVAFDSSKSHQHAFLEMLNPFVKASNRNKAYALDIIDRARQMDTELTIPEIRDMLPKGIGAKDAQEVIEGIVSVRTMTDAAYVVENKVFRDRQLALGRRHIKHGEFEAMASPASLEAARNMRVAYDPATDKIVKLDTEMVNRIYEEGGQLAVSGATHGADEAVQTRNILVSGETQIKELPQQVLKYDANYITTLYKDQYFVTQKKKKLTLDGEVVPDHALPVKVLTTAKSRKEAEAAVARLREANPDIEYSFKNSRELTSGQVQESYESLRRSTGGLFFSKKGERLKDTVGNLAEVEDPVTAIQTQAAMVSRLVALRPVTDLMKQRFVNTFPQFSEKGFPKSKGAIVNPELVKDEAAEAAKVMWDYINMLENGNVAGTKWQSAMVGFGEWVEDVTGSAKLGSFVRTKVGAKDPMSAARGATFLSTIVLNPARQLLIQSQQYLFLAGIDPTFVLTGKAQRQGSALLLSSIGDKALPDGALAKLAGMSVGEFKQARQAFKESGLTEAIDSHLLGRDALLEVSNEITRSKAGALGRQAGNLVTSAINTVKSAGFDMGERINISNTYMLAWKRYRDKFPDADMTSKQAKKEIAADARQLALGMTQVGGFGYQEGLLSMATQFFSIQHKAFLAMMRGIPGLSKYGNKAITPQEARRIMAFQTGIYGGAGMGVNALIDEGLDAAEVGDLDPTTRMLIHGGAWDLMLNQMLKTATGEDTNVAFAENMSAGQGFAPALLQYMDDIASGDVSVLELMAGASASVGSRFGVATATLKSILGAPEELDKNRMKLLLNDFASIASGYRNYISADTMRNLGVWVDKNRNIMPIPVNDTEALVYSLVGIAPAEVGTFYHTVQTQKESKERLEGIANEAFSRITRIIGDTAEQKDRGFEYILGQLELFNKESYVLQAILGKDSADYYNVMGQVQDLLKQRVKGESAWIGKLSQAILNNTYGEDLPSMINYLGRNTDLDQKQLDAIKTMFEVQFDRGAK